MTASHRSGAILLTISLIFVLSGCLSKNSQQRFAMSFLPAPLPVAAEAQETPAPHHSLYLNSSPKLVQKSLPQIEWPTDVDSRLLNAEQHFEAAKKLYQQSDVDAARVEFNRSIDVLLTAPENIQNNQRIERKLNELVDTIYRYDLEG